MGTTVTDQQLDALAGILRQLGHCDQRTLDRARRAAADADRRLDAILIQLGLVSERGLADAYARLLSVPIAAADGYPVSEPVLPDVLAPAFLRHARAIPLAADAETLVLAAADPLDPFTPSAVAAATGRRVQVQVAVPIELEAAMNRLYPDGAEAAPATDPDVPLEDDADRLKDLASEAPVIRLVNLLITRAVETQASDIHIEPFEDRLRVRYRYDGVLHEAETPPRHLAAAITSRIKIMARLDIAERRMPQDGRIRMAVRGQDVDFRVSTIPSLYGETVVLRILDRTAVVFDYGRLGLSPAVIRRFGAALDLPNGIVLVTGPTGSGKTTTLYTGLLALNAVTRKIITVEDPIEYHLHGINQIQVRSQIGLSFASLLRSILRQDPDVIMVGEIRDGETAQIAVQAALTGHLVLSTLHTNSAAAAVTRLRDMGVEDYLLTAVLRGVMAQRLVRRLCPECRQQAPAAPELVQRFGLDRRTSARPITLSYAVGCPACRQTGYRGRAAIAEFLPMGPEIERLIFSRADHSAIERAAVAEGMESMFDAGLAAALAGETTIEEVTRSIRADP
ncbi:GspE/PulE family protein [Rhodopila globiformis]|uniref:Type II secretion system protein GspE n=1 Tax=Rhodopila globiformis TaxID=1071 RepID=A0A2S6NK82_RHOGL|nr:ATPase, T2SS/T4P/T4SS family [Rhodopila globiformis]PPQ35372.1 type II secretion system protein GspE [Rhodopila globiformis]